MLELRPVENHGITSSSRLRSIHHFSFASFMNEARSAWGPLTTLNQVTIPAGGEVGPNPIDGVDIVRIVRRRVLGTSGTLGQGLRTLEGEVEVISTTAGVILNDRNLSRSDVEYVELRLTGSKPSRPPSRAVTRMPDRKRMGEFIVLASGMGDDRHALPLNTAARVSASRVRSCQSAWQPLRRGSRAYLMILTGQGVANGHLLKEGDGLAIADEPGLSFLAHRGSELLLVEALESRPQLFAA